MAFGPNPPLIQVHLCVTKGNEAIRFYEKAFDGVCTMKQMADDGVRVMHANIDLFGSEVMLHDEFPESDGQVRSPLTRGGASVAININLPRPGDVDAAVARAEKAGAVVLLAPGDVFWGARYARLRDPFGHIWAFNAPLPNPTGQS
jgi:PhnB protein